jgi:hypothetical protein
MVSTTMTSAVVCPLAAIEVSKCGTAGGVSCDDGRGWHGGSLVAAATMEVVGMVAV